VKTEDCEKLRALLQSKVGVREEGGQNCGAAVLEFQQATYNGPGDSWCMSFQIWGLRQVLGHCPFPISGRCQTVRDYADKKGWTVGRDQVEEHSIGFVVNAENHAHHTFYVAESPGEDDCFRTIEGNTNDRGDSNGDGVYDRVRGGAFDNNRYVFIPLRVVPT
jgi:hypothetical protein